MKPQSRHQCIIYEGAPSHKLPALAAVICQMMDSGYRCLYLNTPAMVAGMRSCLAAKGIDVAKETAATRIKFSSELPFDGDDFDVDHMLQSLEETLDIALMDGFKGLWTSGDMTWELGAAKNFEKLIEYELKLEALFQKRKELHGICQYHTDTLPPEVIRRGLLTHQAVFINETLSRLNPYYFKSDSELKNPVVDSASLDKMIVDVTRSNSSLKKNQ